MKLLFLVRKLSTEVEILVNGEDELGHQFKAAVCPLATPFSQPCVAAVETCLTSSPVSISLVLERIFELERNSLHRDSFRKNLF